MYAEQIHQSVSIRNSPWQDNKNVSICRPSTGMKKEKRKCCVGVIWMLIFNGLSSLATKTFLGSYWVLCPPLQSSHSHVFASLNSETRADALFACPAKSNYHFFSYFCVAYRIQKISCPKICLRGKVEDICTNAALVYENNLTL